MFVVGIGRMEIYFYVEVFFVGRLGGVLYVLEKLCFVFEVIGLWFLVRKGFRIEKRVDRKLKVIFIFFFLKI